MGPGEACAEALAILLGTYQDEEGQGACKPCPPGNQCPAGSVEPTKCRPGFYADQRQPFCKECARGTYQDNEGQRASRWQLLPGLQDGQTLRLPRRQVWHQAVLHHTQRLRRLPHQREWRWQQLAGCDGVNACPPPHPPAACSHSLCTFASLLPQSYTDIVGQNKCKKCTTGLWTARKTGQKLCWDNTKNLPPTSR